ncbi:peptide chain release factor N(5)-glutamine methyltransferase [Dictyobacter arantiisoli]|uniref:Release factor glutamine methyltransferase n=1 Tax=Dictyobacter arantiisoli TaxID=2014874 RepID=A0A5A5THE4_9CHLR|nr:peptide chain release factor N(5)-glutamine methyltransferase [Dictyobacter arantiisoli]GCF10483.1 release factor glutamine methyltransferase [Dictyobacter arantiisoli]
MTVFQEALRQGTQMLTQADIPGARLDAQLLLGSVVGMDRARLLAYLDQELTPVQEQDYFALLQRRCSHEPIAYILGQREFYGRDFSVDSRVLIPRPETELLVEVALTEIRARLARDQVPVVADIGTGSGAIPITLCLEEAGLPSIYACDVSADALSMTRRNCERHHVTERVRLLKGDLLSPLPEPVDVLLANLPYVGLDEMHAMSQDVLAYEPHLALFSGPHGLDLLYRLCKEVYLSGTLRVGGTMLLEIGYQQCEPLTHLLHELWPQATVTCRKDYAGWDRLIQLSL